MITALITLATSVFQFLGGEAATKYLDELVDLEKAILKESSKPYAERDDAKLETLHKRLAIITEAARSELILRTQKP